MTMPPSNSPPPPPGGGSYQPHQHGGHGGPSDMPWQSQHQQQPWAGGPPPKRRGNGWKWALGGVALVAVIAVTAVVSISIAGGGDSSPAAHSGDADSEFASADDTGPVNIITEDPTCAAWMPINNTVAQIQKKGWDKRDISIPSTEWTSELRSQYDEVSRALSTSADQTVALARQTPHRVMRELYEQVIIYSRAYVDALSNYTAEDNYLIGVSAAASATLVNICTAIRYDSAAARSPLISPAEPPPSMARFAEGPVGPRTVMTTADPVCGDWERIVRQFDADTSEWQDLDPNIPASAWTEEQRSTVEAVIPVMNEFANKLEELGRTSSDGVIEDFAVLAAQYRRAYTESLPSYASADSYLSAASARAAWIIVDACKAAEA